MTTLIVGCGYLGLRIARLLTGRGDVVFGTTRTPARAGKLAARGIRPVVADVLDRPSLAALPATERVVHCVGYDRSAGPGMREVYVDGFRNLVDLLGPSVARLVHVGSTGVFGRAAGEWVDERTPPGPVTESGRTCLEAESVVGGLEEGRAVTLRLAGLYGPGRVIYRAVLERGDPIPASPDRPLNLVHVDDAAAAVLAALDADRPGPLYLVADDRPVSRLEYATRLAGLIGAPLPRFAPPPPGSPGAEREGVQKKVSSRLIREELGWQPAYPDVAAGLPQAVGAASDD